MSISPAGVIFLLVLFYCITRGSKSFRFLLLLCLVCETFLRKGYVIAIGDSSIKFDLISEYALIMYCIIHLNKMRIPKLIMRGWQILVIAYILPIFLLLLFPSNDYVATHDVLWDNVLYEGESLVHPSITPFVLMMTMKWCLFTFVFLYIYSKWGIDNYKDLINRFRNISNVFINIGILEFVFKNIFRLNDIWGKVLLFVFGQSESTVYEGRLRGSLYELTLFTQEASHYALVLCFICIIIMANNLALNKKVFDKYFWFAIGLMLLSTSFSAVYLVIIVFGIYLVHRWFILKPKMYKTEISVFCVVLFMIFSSLVAIIGYYSDGYIGARLSAIIENWDVITSKEFVIGSAIGDMSSQVRLVSTIQTLLVFFKRPLFGYSIMSIDAHSCFTIYLASVGFFGLYCWIRFFFFLFPLRREIRPLIKPYVLLIVMQLFTHLLGGDLRQFYGAMLLLIMISFCFICAKTKIESNINKF